MAEGWAGEGLEAGAWVEEGEEEEMGCLGAELGGQGCPCRSLESMPSLQVNPHTCKRQEKKCVGEKGCAAESRPANGMKAAIFTRDVTPSEAQGFAPSHLRRTLAERAGGSQGLRYDPLPYTNAGPAGPARPPMPAPL